MSPTSFSEYLQVGKSVMEAYRLFDLDDGDAIHPLITDRAHVIIQRFEVREHFEDLSALIAFLECDVRRFEQVATFYVVSCPLQTDIRHAIVTKVAPADVDPHMLADLNSCQFVSLPLWPYFLGF
jgi:hypothetical protein